MNGGLVVDKPAGPTSHDVVARVRRAIGIRRIGHTGTLDPLATGVLLLLVGRATRLAQYLTGDEKAYIAGVRLGSATPTYDAEGRTPGEDGGAAAGQPAGSGVPVTLADVREALEAFRGTFLQTPPPFSAKKVGGTPAYKLARRQQDVALSPVEVTVRELTLAGYAEGLATIHVTASSGFYVRSLAHDLGARLGCGGHLETLRRVRTGAFTEEQAVPLSVIEAEGTEALSRGIPMSELVARLPRVVVSERGATRVLCGQPLDACDLHEAAAGDLSESTGAVRVLDREGALLAIARYGPGGPLRPVVVLV
jgi:tRNA pseudouridine55 synthase